MLGIDETIERRWGKRIAAKGIYRDAVRSSHEFFVKCSGLRWVCLMLLAPIPWAKRVWALPVLTALAPSERYHRERGHPAQEADRLGAPDAPPGPALAARAPTSSSWPTAPTPRWTCWPGAAGCRGRSRW